MSAKTVPFDRIIYGIADYDKESLVPDGVAWLRSVDYRTDPRRITILPRTVKESGSVYQDLPKWFTPRGTTGYIYDASGNLYQRTSAGSHTLIRAVGQSHGNGLAYYGEDDFVYYTNDIGIGRYGQFSAGSPAFADDFLGAQGGVPTNTNVVDMEAGSSHVMSKTDTASLSITGDIAMEIYLKPESLPTVGNTMTLISKWNEQSNQRSYRFDIKAISGYFGDGSDGTYTVSADATDAPIDSAASGTLGTNSLSATNASFAAGQVIMVHQSQGTGVGTWQRTKITSYTSGTITTEDNLNFSYATGAQVLVLKQYTNVTINSTKTLTAKAWNGTVGGILGFIANDTITVNGTLTATGKGYRGGAAGRQDGTPTPVYTGEGTIGQSTLNANGNARYGSGGGCGQNYQGGKGGGGGHATVGENGWDNFSMPSYSYGAEEGQGGAESGTADLTTMTFGGGGGGTTAGGDSDGGNGGNGGGIIFLAATTLTINTGAAVVSHGLQGDVENGTPGGSGAGGSILFKVQVGTLGTNLIGASGAAKLISGYPADGNYGGAGAHGRIHVDYLTSYTGTATTPTINASQDNSLVTTTTYQLRLSVSSTGSNEEILTKNATITTAEHQHFAVSWDASASTAEFMVNGASIGDSIGTLTAIYNSTAAYAVGAYYNSSGSATAFIDGLVDETRLWNVTRTEEEIFANKDVELIGNEGGLAAYHQYDGNLSDSTSNANDLTHSAGATYSTDVPFSAPTTRLDKDQEDTSTGATSATATAISEGASGRQTFVPTKDPQKSIKIFISDTGDDSDWTVTVHDSLNREVASKTLTHAQVVVGANEFTFATPWRPIIGASYHFHVTTTTTTGTPLVVSGSSNNFETAEFTSYYQFLVTDTGHPLMHYSNMLLVGNERYLAVWNASSYNPHRLTLPSGYRLRCFGQFNEYAAMGFMKGSTIDESDQGLLVLWDGTSTTYNLALSVPEGAINAMIGSGGQLDFVAGSHLDLLRYVGGAEFQKLKRLPKITNSTTAEVFPGAMTMWQALERIGIAGDSDSTTIERGVYTYGRLNDLYPESLSYDYPISTGSRLASVDVGMAAVSGNKLLIGWRDGTAYGVDVVDPAGSSFPTATIEYLIRDEGGVFKEKQLQAIRADYEPLVSGHSFAVKYKINRSSDWSAGRTSSFSSDTDLTTLRHDVDQGRNKEYQVAVDLATTISTSPALLSTAAVVDIMEEEQFV